MTMERDRYRGPITFTCDGIKCHEVLETETTEFHPAISELRAAKWKAVLVDEEWEHLCPDCQ